MTAHSDLDAAVNAYQQGHLIISQAFDIDDTHSFIVLLRTIESKTT